MNKTEDRPIQWEHIFIVLLVNYSIWLKWKSFGYIDFKGGLWIAPVCILAGFLVLHRLSHKRFSPVIHWIVIGLLFWDTWQCIHWIFTTRGISFFIILDFLTYPISLILGTSSADSTLLVITILIFLLSIWGGYWIYKNPVSLWVLKKSKIGFGLLFLLIAIVTFYTKFPESQKQCNGFSTLHNCLFTTISNSIGMIATFCITGIFFFWAIVFGYQQMKQHGVTAILFIAMMMPIWIEIFFNPSGILQVPYSVALDNPNSFSVYFPILETNMQMLNFLSPALFFNTIPSGLILLSTKKAQKRSITILSGLGLSIMVAVLFITLNRVRSVFEYALRDQITFLLMGFMVLMPLVILLLLPPQDQNAQNKPNPPDESPPPNLNKHTGTRIP